MNQSHVWFDQLNDKVNDLFAYVLDTNAMFLSQDDINYVSSVIRWCANFKCTLLHTPHPTTNLQRHFRTLLSQREQFARHLAATEPIRRAATTLIVLDKRNIQRQIDDVIKASKNLLDFAIHHSHTFENREEMIRTLQILQAVSNLSCPLVHRHSSPLNGPLEQLGIIHMRIWQISNKLCNNCMARVIPPFITLLTDHMPGPVTSNSIPPNGTFK